MPKTVSKIRTWEEMEQKEGKLIPVSLKALKPLFGYPLPHKMIWNEVFEDLVLKVGVGVLPPHRQHKLRFAIPEKNLSSVKKLLEFYIQKNEKLKKDKELVPDDQVARKWGIPLEEFLDAIENDNYQELISEKGISETNGRTVYYLNVNKVKQQKVNTLSELSKHFEYPKYNALGDYARRGWIKQPEKYAGTHLWELDDLIKQIPKALKIAGERFQDSPRKNMGGSFDELLGEDLMYLIEEYLSDRKTGTPIIDPWYGNRYGKITDIHQHLIQIQRALYKIICHRAGIKGYERLNKRNTFRELTDLEMLKFNETREMFKISDMVAKDIDAIRKGISSDNVWHKTATIFVKPFLLYIFRNIEDEVDETIEIEKLEFFNTKKRFKRIVEKLTVAHHEPESKRVKVFLSREDDVKIFNFLEGINTTYATAWMISFLAGIRPEELNNLRVEYFRNPITGQSWLDENGFLKPDPTIKTFYNQDGSIDESFGYVKLFLPAKATKQERSASDAELGTLIVPVLVKQINKYLREEIYSVSDKPGYGYLFRRVNQNPDSKLKTYFTFLNSLRSEMPFLTDLQKEWLILKDGRRSMNNMILNGLVNDKNISQMKLLRAAQVQMRHSQRGLTGAISEVNYTKGISESEYVKIISETLEYPIDLQELIKWEIDKGYRDENDIPSEFVNKIKGISQIKKEFETKEIQNPSIIEEIYSLNELQDNLQKQFEALNSILLLPSRKQKESLKALGHTQVSVIEKMSELENQINTVKNSIVKLRKGE